MYGYITFILFVLFTSVRGQQVEDVYAFRGEEQIVPCRHGLGEYLYAVYWHMHEFHPNGSIEQETLMVEYDIDEDEPYKVHPLWEDRINFTFPSGDITFYELRMSDDARYECIGRIATSWGIEAPTDLIVYDKPVAMSITWSSGSWEYCGSIVPRIITSTHLYCSVISRPGANVTWTYDVIDPAPIDNSTRGGEIDGNTTCTDMLPYHRQCSRPLSIVWDPNETEVILYTCTTMYEYLGEVVTQEACVLYDPEPVPSAASVSAAMWRSLFLGILLAFLTTA